MGRKSKLEIWELTVSSYSSTAEGRRDFLGDWQCERCTGIEQDWSADAELGYLEIRESDENMSSLYLLDVIRSI